MIGPGSDKNLFVGNKPFLPPFCWRHFSPSQPWPPASENPILRTKSLGSNLLLLFCFFTFICFEHPRPQLAHLESSSIKIKQSALCEDLPSRPLSSLQHTLPCWPPPSWPASACPRSPSPPSPPAPLRHLLRTTCLCPTCQPCTGPATATWKTVCLPFPPIAPEMVRLALGLSAARTIQRSGAQPWSPLLDWWKKGLRIKVWNYWKLKASSSWTYLGSASCAVGVKSSATLSFFGWTTGL